MHDAILLDPFASSSAERIKMISLKRGLDPLYSALSYPENEVGNVGSVAFDEGDTLWVDGEGLFTQPTGWIVIEGAHQPFAGRGIITGTTQEGDTCAPNLVTPDWCRRNIRFIRTLPGDLPR